MARDQSCRGVGRALVIATLALVVPIGSVLAQDEPSPLPTPVTASGSMVPVAVGATPVRFSVAPVDGDGTELTLLTRWRSCGIESGEPGAASAQLIETDADVAVRVDVRTSPTGEPCEATSPVRIPISLSAPLGDRTIRDAAAPAYQPAINLVDPVDTGLEYSCSAYADEGYSVAELLGPGLGIPEAAMPQGAEELRIVRYTGDEVHALGPVQPKGWVQQDVWRLQADGWTRAATGYRCHLLADLSENMATATWRLRGRRPSARSKSIRIWVREQVCNGRPLYGRVAQPIVQEHPGAILIVTASMREIVTPLGERVEEPEEYFGDYPGRDQARIDGFTFIDCPGIGPAPYVINLYRRLGDRALLDGGVFPPREHRRGRAGPDASASSPGEVVNPGDRAPSFDEVTSAASLVSVRESFAGYYLDQTRAGMPVFLFSEDCDAATSELREILGDDSMFAVREVEWSLQELESVKRSVSEARKKLDKRGITRVSVGYDIIRNRIKVGVLGPVDRARDVLQAHAAAIRVVKQGVPQLD